MRGLLSFVAVALWSMGANAQAPAAAAAAAGKPVTGSGIPNKTNAVNPVCIPHYDLRDAIMGGLYQGRCTDNARAAVRLAFHDAGTFSLNLQANALPNGGPDGSMLTDPNEVLRSENNGLQKIVSLLQPIAANFTTISPGDVLHLAGILAVLACPGGPKINYWVGRPAPRNIAPDGLLPSPEDPVPTLIARFADMGFSIRDLMALIGAHTTGKQRFVDPSQAGDSFDTTVDIWDTRFYTQTQATTTQPGTFKLDSDRFFSTNASTTVEFSRFIGNQGVWLADYASAHERMSVLGLSTSALTSCNEILPLPIDLTTVEVTPATGKGGAGGAGGTNKPATDPAVDPVKLEAAIQQFRSIWLVPGTVTT